MFHRIMTLVAAVSLALSLSSAAVAQTRAGIVQTAEHMGGVDPLNLTDGGAGSTTVTTIQTVPVTDVLNANAYTFTEACFGEPVTFTGAVRLVDHVTRLTSGETRVVSHLNVQGATATGVRSGLTNRLVAGVSNTYTTAATPPFHYNVTLNFNVIGTGAAPNLLVKLDIHTIVNANGVTTVSIENMSLECK